MKKDKLFAPFLMLLVGAITYFCLMASDYSFKDALIILLIVLIVFYIIGLLIQRLVNKFVAENEAKAKEEAEQEGAVIEKEAPPDELEGGELPPLNAAANPGNTENSSDEEAPEPNSEEEAT